VHGRIKRQIEKRDWHLPSDTTEEYCRHIVAEQQIILPTGRKKWMQTAPRNDYLDCEKLATAMAQHQGYYLREVNSQPKRRILSPGLQRS
jgi:hypothetical protein